MRWQPGDVVALRHLNAGRVSYIWPMIVVADGEDEIALYIARGTPTRRRVGADGRPLVIEPDLSAWRWKDEDELADAVRIGRFTAAEAARVRQDGEEAVRALERRDWPFDRGWEAWRPENPYAMPQLREEWADVAAG